MQLILLGLLIVVPFQSESSQQDRDEEPIYSAESDWITVSPADVGASVSMPKKPKHVAIEFDKVIRDHLLVVHQYKNTINRGTANIVFAYHDIHVPVEDRKTIKNTLDFAVKGAVARVFGKLLSHEPIRHGKHYGRDFVFVAEPSGMKLKFSSRVILVGQRMYQLNIVMTQDAYDPKMVKKFFASFELVDDDSDLPPRPKRISSK